MKPTLGKYLSQFVGAGLFRKRQPFVAVDYPPFPPVSTPPEPPKPFLAMVQEKITTSVMVGEGTQTQRFDNVFINRAESKLLVFRQFTDKAEIWYTFGGLTYALVQNKALSCGHDYSNRVFIQSYSNWVGCKECTRLEVEKHAPIVGQTYKSDLDRQVATMQEYLRQNVAEDKARRKAAVETNPKATQTTPESTVEEHSLIDGPDEDHTHQF